MQATLRRAIGPLQFFALAIGVIIGSAWVVLIGDLLELGGPAGAILGFSAGGVIMMLVAAAYGELAGKMPVAGGEFIFAYRVFGPAAGFAVGWFITLYLVASTAFEAISLTAILQTLLPQLRGPVLYVLLGNPVTAGGLGIGLGGTTLITFLNHRDVRLAVGFQSIVTYSFLVVAVGVILVGLRYGSLANVHPLFAAPRGQVAWVGTLSIFATSAYFLTGFQAVPQAIEERAEGVSARTISAVMVVSVATAAVFLCLVVLAVTMASPWQTTARTSMATAAALARLPPGRILATLVLIAAAASLLKTWNALALMASRLLMAQARERLLPASLAVVHPVHRTPAGASLLVGVLTLAGVLLGRGALLPIVDMGSVCLAGTFVLVFVAVIKLRRAGLGGGLAREEGSLPTRLRGGVWSLGAGVSGASIMAAFAVVQPLIGRKGGVPLEWLLLLAWGVIGVAVFRRTDVARRHRGVGSA